jgi:hypothetical protein
MPSSNTLVQNVLENYIPTAVATLIEPMWILINRLFCMLQPLEELQNSKARANKSIDTDYSSLPPQLVIFKALKSKHFILAAVCAMALLANLLAVAFAGLFLHKTVDIRQEATFWPPLDLKFAPINGSIGPWENNGRQSSGAYRGGEGHDQFYITESNYTRNSSLPAWADDRMFYMPVFSEGAQRGQPDTAHFEAKTKSFGAILDCEQLQIGKDFNASIANFNTTINSLRGSMNVSIPSGSGRVRCSSRDAMPVSNCRYERSAWELVQRLTPRANSTRQEADVCMRSVVLGWARTPQGVCPSDKDVPFNKENALFIRCSPRFITGSATIRVDAKGLLQRPADGISLDGDIANMSSTLFSTDPINLIGQSNIYLFKSSGTLDGVWHNDSFAYNFINHFMIRASDRRLVDPSLPVPKFEDVLGPLNKAYSKLFAVWLGRNKENLLLPLANQEEGQITGIMLQPAQRLFLSTTMFIISEAILCTYVFVAIWVYARRPGQYLPRLPTSIAAIIALFAASAAVQDMKGTSHLDRKGRAQHLERIDARYGYGSFVGGDGRIHIGIEKATFLRPKARKTWLERKLPLFRKRSVGEE